MRSIARSPRARGPARERSRRSLQPAGPVRVPLGPTGAFAGFASQNAARNPARPALRAIQLFRTWRNRMNRPGARLTECWGQIPPARDCWSRKSIKQPKVVWSISASARTEAVFSPGRPIRRPMGAPPRRPHRGFCWGFLGLSRGPARSPVLACCRAAPRALP